MRIGLRQPARSRPRFLRFRDWPLRWRLAAVSASLTLVILMLFGAVIGGARDAAHP